MTPSAKPERRRGGAGERRKSDSNGSPTTEVMQGYERMGRGGRRRLQVIGVMMMTAAVAVGLWQDLTLYRFVFVIIVTVLGAGFIFPQYGLLLVEAVPDMVAKLLPTSAFTRRPDRRNNDTGDTDEE